MNQGKAKDGFALVLLKIDEAVNPRRKTVRSLSLPSPERTGLSDLLHGLTHLTGVLEHV